ncbi:hypothetical protein Emag_002463 [Eimeria magna]
MRLSLRARLTPKSPPAAPLFSKPQPSASSGVLRLLQRRVELRNLLMLPALFAAFLSVRLLLFVAVAAHRETDLRRGQQRQQAPLLPLHLQQRSLRLVCPEGAWLSDCPSVAPREQPPSGAMVSSSSGSRGGCSSSSSGGVGGGGRGRGRPQRACAAKETGAAVGDLLAGSHIGAVGRRRGGAMWCHVCRDSVSRSEDNVVECTACPKRFHLECLQQEGIVGQGEVVDANTWLCPQCLEEAEEDEITNDDKCFLCRKADIEDECGGKLIMCDGCPHSYHMSCLKLTIEPDDEKWFCPDCNPSAFNTEEIRRLGRGATAPRRGDGVNSSTCYVCQRPGKLLGCDFCVNSFHPSCLVDVDWDAIGEEWECPVCKGFDPLANQMHKRWTRQEIETKRKERAKNYEKYRAKITRYRNRFLVVHQKDLGPFVNPKILQALARTLRANISGTAGRRGGRGGGGAGGASRLSVERSLSDVLEQLEDEAGEEAEKFTRRAYRSCRHASGRPIDGLPLREGITLKPHQEEGVDWLLRSFLTGGAILADEMVAAKGLYDLYVTTYETVKSEEEFFVEQIPHWQCIVLDEAHRIKNASGAIRHSLDRVQGNMRLLLTGTPLQNNAQELFTLINFLMPDVFRDSLVIEQAFAQNAKSASAGKAGAKALRGKSKAAALADMDVDSMFKQEDLNKIRQLLDRVMLRRLKEQAIALPRKVFHDIWLPISDLTAKWYRRLLEIKSLQEEARSNSTRVNFRKMLGLVIKMRILCAHPKGVCARDSQLQRLQAFFTQEDPALQEEVTTAARELQSVEGAAHLAGSSKLLFLDKLMCHLHFLNCKYVPAYERDYMAHKNDAATYEYYKRHEEAVVTALAEGQKPPRRPKRSELIGIPEFRALLERGLPSRTSGTARDEAYLKEGLYPAEPLLPTKESCNPGLQQRIKGTNASGDVLADDEDLGEGPASEDEADQHHEQQQQQQQQEDSEEALPRSRSERRSRRHLILDEEDVMQADLPPPPPGAAAAGGKEEEEGSAAASGAAASQEGGNNETQQQPSAVKEEQLGMAKVEEQAASLIDLKREGEGRSNVPTACCTGSPSSHADHKEGADALDAAATQQQEQQQQQQKGETVKGEALEAKEETAVKAEGQQGAKAKEEETLTPRIQRLLIFTQFQLVLDELEAYCKYRGWRYLRLDGSTNKFVRELDIRDFNNDNTSYFVYLISTRAGGLGINLTAANHVVIYDHDWNPFIDLQAVDRAHRIGQQREVHVWSLVSEWTVEERMAFRREQKLRLDKLLVQQQIEAGAEAFDGEEADDEKEPRSEKISTDEVRRLMLHGKKAIVDISSLCLEDLVERPRQPLPVLGDDEEPLAAEAVGEDDVDEKNLVDITEVMDEEAEERRVQQQLAEGTEEAPPDLPAGKPPPDGEEAKLSGGSSPCHLDEEPSDSQPAAAAAAATGSAAAGPATAGPAAAGKGGLEAELQSAGVLWRSGRERKKPVALYVPQEFTQREERRKLRHETRCFVCGNGKDHVQTSVDREGKPVEVAYGDLVCCSGCPKVYHRCCEGLSKDVKKSWRCRWHECCLCFRKTSQCGNMLIHCARCPTSFCYDCFPPDYCRYNVGEDYYLQLRQRGLNVTPQNWILLLCSKCKAVEEQQTRRRLTKEEKDQEKLMQQELRQQQRQLHQDGARLRLERDEVKYYQRQKAEEERRWFDHKQAVDRLDEAAEIALRQAYQHLFPAAFLSEVEKRTAAAKAAQRASREAAVAEAMSAASGVGGAGSQEQAAFASAAAAALKKVAKKPTNQLANMKLPSQSLGVCENCRFPCHGSRDYPGPCCFPDEVISKFVVRTRPLPLQGGGGAQGTAAAGGQGGGGPSGQEGPLGVVDLEASPGDGGAGALGKDPAADLGAPSGASPGGGAPHAVLQALSSSAALLEGSFGEASGPGAAGAAGDPRVRYMQRQVCAGCHELRIGKRSHTRKHCPTLTPDQLHEYDERRAKMRLVAELLLAREPIPDPNPSAYVSATPQRLKAFFQQFQEAADKILEECMVAAGLQHAVASRFAAGKKGMASPAGQGAAAAAAAAAAAGGLNAGGPHNLSSFNSMNASKDRISMILNRSKELLLLRRQTELQVLASLSGANGQGPSPAALGGVQQQLEQQKAMMLGGGGGGSADRTHRLTPPSDANNSDVEVLGISRGAAQQQPGDLRAQALTAGSNGMTAAGGGGPSPGAPSSCLSDAAAAGRPVGPAGKRGSIEGANGASRGGVSAAAAKRQRKVGAYSRGAAEAGGAPGVAGADVGGAAGLAAAGGHLSASAVAAAVKQKSIIDFFTSRNKAAAGGSSSGAAATPKQQLLVGAGPGGGASSCHSLAGRVVAAGLNPWSMKQQGSDTESD